MSVHRCHCTAKRHVPSCRHCAPCVHCACRCVHRLEDGWNAEPESAAAGDVQALRDQVKALEVALAASLAAEDAALGKVALLEAENQALRGQSTGGWSLTSRGACGGRLGPV